MTQIQELHTRAFFFVFFKRMRSFLPSDHLYKQNLSRHNTLWLSSNSRSHKGGFIYELLYIAFVLILRGKMCYFFLLQDDFKTA